MTVAPSGAYSLILRLAVRRKKGRIRKAHLRQDQNWVVARSDQTGRAVLQFNDREAPPGTLVDVILYYPDGALRRLADVPIETILAGGVLEITGTDIPRGGYNAPPPQPQSGILPGILPNIGIGIGIGVGGHRGDRDHSRDP